MDGRSSAAHLATKGLWLLVFACFVFAASVLGCLWLCFRLLGQQEIDDAIAAEGDAAIAAARRIRIPTLNYSALEIKSPATAAAADCCPICLAPFREELVKKMPVCCHYFHPGCIDLWLDSHTSCPVCREELRLASAEP
ncbi:hypothetical protein SELMODRAFT_412606 [Selaginella moellendorffii]|uniref:RING-type E3 ubiquitin transferase n=1 Tax=Selaginella moellendorffii TaxID=88036 RepID=D8RM15_SELML|nr:RING-H2 finger protein ATL38 [Selaginella moellendorffii]XP_002993547.1 RING-H2 finger protein ATL38 [Selaginella moellendorffii]EFJ05376.1 hypothetical protein SELMODRAFT_431617 [Selaginella moellendorffii]EFJ26811.1 hypothetical protein SELMODRAFT_412606 [Selaginella moellendorffii]|eukprot:XP_002971894.1 RING-H2 finger protein ATL38 [Selaginella moellendorffii]